MKVRRPFAVAVLGVTMFAGMPSAQAHVSLRLAAGGTYTGVIGGGGLVVAFDCAAAGVGDVVSVAITQCQLTTSSVNKTIALPGPAATIGGTATVPFAPFQLCWSVVFTFSDAHTKPLSGCNPLLAPDVAGGVPQLAGVGFTLE